MATDRTSGATVPLAVRAPLDTANPVTDRAPGTLTVAKDVHTRYWGPREGTKTLESPHDNLTANGSRPTTGRRPIIFVTANSEYVEGYLTSVEQWNLPTSFTLDLVFQPDDVATQANNDLQLFEWRFNGSYSPIIVNFKSAAAGGDARKVEVLLRGSSSPGTGGANTITLTSTSQLSVGTDPEDRHWIRVIRESGTTPRFRLYVNGTQEATANKGSSNDEWEALATDTPTWYWSNDTGAADTRFDGKILRTTLRTGAYTDDLKAGFADWLYPRSPNTFFHAVNSQDVWGYLKDFSMYGAHGTVAVAGVTGTDDFTPPFLRPVQGMATFEDLKGRVWNVVMAGGNLVWDRLR